MPFDFSVPNQWVPTNAVDDKSYPRWHGSSTEEWLAEVTILRLLRRASCPLLQQGVPEEALANAQDSVWGVE